MVEKIQADGGYARDILQDLGRDKKAFSNTRFYYKPFWRSRLAESLEVISMDNKVDKESILIEKARDNSAIFDVLSLPAGEILLPQLYRDVVGLPPEESTYLIHGVNHYWDAVSTTLVIANGSEDIESIGKRKFRDEGWRRRDFSVEVQKISSEYFIELLKEKIDNNEEVDPRLLQYANMRKYYEMKFKQRKQEKSK